MAASCGASCAKFMLFVFNIVFFLSGGAMLGIGIWLRVDDSILELIKLTEFATDGDQMENVAWVLIAVGAFVFLVGFLGCFGAVTENRCMLGVYIFFLLVVMGIEIAAGVLALVYKDKVEKELDEELLEQLGKRDYYNSTELKYYPFGISFNYAQYKFDCCGVNGPNDYRGSRFAKNNPSLKIPYSCCVLKVEEKKEPKAADVNNWATCLADFNANVTTSTELHTNGCHEEVLDWAKTKLIMLTGIGLGIAALELFGFIFAVCLCRNIIPKDD